MAGSKLLFWMVNVIESLILFIEVSWPSFNLKTLCVSLRNYALLSLHFPVYLPSLKFYVIYYLVGFAWSSFFNVTIFIIIVKINAHRKGWISLLHFKRFIYWGWKITGLPQLLLVITIFFIFCKVLSLTVNILRLVLLQNDSGHWSEMLLSLQVNSFKNKLYYYFMLHNSFTKTVINY